MSTTTFSLVRFGFLLLVLSLASVGCDTEPTQRTSTPPKEDPPKSSVKTVAVGKNITLEISEGRRRVFVDAMVCLNKGQLELLLCRKQTKEHEAVLSADIDARELHKALLLAGAKAGSPVVFDPKYNAAHGQVINVTLEYELKGKKHSVRGQEWVRNSKTGKPLTENWVFAGSRLVPNPLDQNKPIYLANEGDVICVSNFESALLDLPIKSSKDNADLAFEANTAKIPPLETKVKVILEPVPEPKK